MSGGLVGSTGGPTAQGGEIIAWLDAAAAFLNPEHVPCHQILPTQLTSLLASIPPPPPALHQHWSETVWAMPGEPFEVYLLRSLAHHRAVTQLSAYFAVEMPYGNHGPSPQMQPFTLSQVQAAGKGTLLCESCVVVAMRMHPSATDLVQVGWQIKPCPNCLCNPHDGVPLGEGLPRPYGGEACVSCGGSLPRIPVLSRRFFLVLQRADGSRSPSVAYGDALHSVMQLGQSVQVLMYALRTDGGQRLCIVHSAKRGPRQQGHVGFHSPGPANTFWDDHFAQQAHRMQRISYPSLVQTVAASVVGQEACKELLLLAAVHTLYRALRAPSIGRWQPLHVLLIGPSKCGKSALLHGICRLYGKYADAVGAPVVHGRTGAEGSCALDAAVPGMSGDTLLGGAALTFPALVLDNVSCQNSTIALQHLLEDGIVCGSVRGSGEGPKAVISSTDVQVVASVSEASSAVLSLMDHFRLVAYVSPCLSLTHSTSIGYNVVATSVARASQSQSPSSSRRSVSVPDTHLPQGGRLADRAFDSFQPHRDFLEMLVREAPDAESLEAALPIGSLRPFYRRQLQAHAFLLEEGVHASTDHLPTPASALSGSGYELPHSALHIPYQRHLQVLTSLSLARAVLETHSRPSVPCWTQDCAEQVWQCYLAHLRAVAHVRSSRYPSLAAASRPVVTYPCVASQSLSNQHRGLVGHAAPPTGIHIGRKKMKLEFLRLLLQMQDQEAMARESAIVPAAVAEDVFNSLGGSSAVGAPFFAVCEQLQQEGLLLRRTGGYHALRWCA